MSSKLASASAIPHRQDRRHSLAPTGAAPAGHTLHRILSDPFSQSRSPPTEPRTAPPVQAPWPTSDLQSRAHPEGDYFDYQAAANIRQSVSPFTQSPIHEEDNDNIKSSTFLLPPQPIYEAQKSTRAPSIHLDTSDQTLVESPLLLDRERPISPSPLGFRDVQDDGSLTSPTYLVRYRWWPYFLLPNPHFLYVTLFPTLNDFDSKTWFQKVLSIIAIPAVFCLTITLPVVDAEQSEAEGEIKLPSAPGSPTTLISAIPDVASELTRPPADEDAMVPRAWNRWLAGVQCIFAPLFITFIFFGIKPLKTRLIGVAGNKPLVPMLYALVSGLIALALLLTFSSPNKPPRWHRALCAVGFLVAIGWISTIADEVVGVLRAFGAILGVSEAILGVTVFAVVCCHHTWI